MQGIKYTLLLVVLVIAAHNITPNSKQTDTLDVVYCNFDRVTQRAINCKAK